jgi:hypothetical protein
LNNSKRIIIIFGLACILVLLASCAGRSNSPLLRINDSDGEGLMAYSCNNVSKNQNIPDYNTKSYMSTRGSVYSEIFRSVTIHVKTVSAGSTLLAKMPPEKTFCVVVPYEFENVSEATAGVAYLLGIDLVKNSVTTGEFETEYIARQHDLTNPMTRMFGAKWKVKYLIFVSENIVHGTDVRVYRDLSISRVDKSAEGGWSPFLTARSDGHNETWFLLTVLKQLKK